MTSTVKKTGPLIGVVDVGVERKQQPITHRNLISTIQRPLPLRSALARSQRQVIARARRFKLFHLTILVAYHCAQGEALNGNRGHLALNTPDILAGRVEELSDLLLSTVNDQRETTWEQCHSICTE